MENALFMLGGMAVFGYVILLLDWLGGRKGRRSKHRPAA